MNDQFTDDVSASIILLNNDLSSLPIAIEMGRLVFDNLKKVILYLMPVCPLCPTSASYDD
jgi:magnesium-transporting ATPase (P-type)